MDVQPFNYEYGQSIRHYIDENGMPKGKPYPREDIILDFIGYDIAIVNGLRRAVSSDVRGIVVKPGPDVSVDTNICIHFLELQNKLTIPVRWNEDVFGEDPSSSKIELVIESDGKPVIATTSDRVVTGRDITVKVNGSIIDPEHHVLVAPSTYICTLKPGNFIFATMEANVVSGVGYCKPLCTSYEHLSRIELTTGVCPSSLEEEQDVIMCDTWYGQLIDEAGTRLKEMRFLDDVPKNTDKTLMRPLCIRVGFHYNWFRDTKAAILEGCDALKSKLQRFVDILGECTKTEFPERNSRYRYSIDEDDTLGNMIVNYGIRAFSRYFDNLDQEKKFEAYRTTLIAYEKKMHDKNMTIDLKFPDVDDPLLADLVPIDAPATFMRGVVGGIITVIDKIKADVDRIEHDAGIPKMYSENPFHK